MGIRIEMPIRRAYMYYAFQWRLGLEWTPGKELYKRTPKDEEELERHLIPKLYKYFYRYGPNAEKVQMAAREWIEHATLFRMKNEMDMQRRTLKETMTTYEKLISYLDERLLPIIGYDIRARIYLAIWEKAEKEVGRGRIIGGDWLSEFVPIELVETKELKEEKERLEELKGDPVRYREYLRNLIDKIIEDPKKYFRVYVEETVLKPESVILREAIGIMTRAEVTRPEQIGYATEDVEELKEAIKEQRELVKKLDDLVEAMKSYGATPRTTEEAVNVLREIAANISELKGIMEKAKIEQEATGVPKEEFCKTLHKAIVDVEKRLVKGRFLEMLRDKWIEIRAIPVSDLLQHKEWIPFVKKIGETIGFSPPPELDKLKEMKGIGPGTFMFKGNIDVEELLKSLLKMELKEVEDVKKLLTKTMREKICKEIQKNINRLERELDELNSRYRFIIAFSDFVMRGDIPMEEVEPDWAKYFRKIAEKLDMPIPEKLRFKPSKDPREQKAYEETKEFLINLIDRFTASLMRETPQEALESILDFDSVYFEELQNELRTWYDRREWLCSDVDVEVEETGEVVRAIVANYLNKLPDKLIEYAGGEDEAFRKAQEILGYTMEDYASDRILHDELMETWRKYCS